MQKNDTFESSKWEGNWIKTPWIDSAKPFELPIQGAHKMIKEIK